MVAVVGFSRVQGGLLSLWDLPVCTFGGERGFVCTEVGSVKNKKDNTRIDFNKLQKGARDSLQGRSGGV